MTTQLEERLTRELSVAPSTTTIVDSNAFADDIIGRVDRRARNHRVVFAGTVSAFVAAISALAWSARDSLRIQTGGDSDVRGQLANPGADVDPTATDPSTDVAGSSIEAAVQAVDGVSALTTILAFVMLLGLPLLAAVVSWRRPANSAFSELERVGRVAITMLMTFFAFVSFTGMLSVRATHRSTPNLVSELHRWSWLALAILIVAALVPWLVRFDLSTVRQAATRDSWGAVRFSVFLPIFFVALRVTSTSTFLIHASLAAVALYWCFSRLPRLQPLSLGPKVAFVAVSAAVIAIGLAAFTYQVMFFPSSSMEPTIEIGERGIVNRLATDVERGDIIIVAFEANSEWMSTSTEQVRRVIGVGGDFVAARNGQLLVNGEVSDYFIGLDDGGTPLADFDEVRVPIDELFLMGDNYSGSLDSRLQGTVSTEAVVGTVGRTFTLGSVTSSNGS